MKTFVKVDKRLKERGKKPRHLGFSHRPGTLFCTVIFYSSRETLWRSSASKSRGFWRYTFLVKQCVCQHPLKSSLIIGHSLYFSSSLSACAASCSSAAGTLAVARARVVKTRRLNRGSTPSVRPAYVFLRSFIWLPCSSLSSTWKPCISTHGRPLSARALGRLCGSRNFHFSATGWSGLSRSHRRTGLDACAFPSHAG